MAAPPAPRARMAVRVEGIVQGVGFRPRVHALATSMGLAGFVGNDEAGVFIEIEGDPPAIDRFLALLRDAPPALAVIERLEARAMDPVGERSFVIVQSEPGGEGRTLIAPDTATCDDCLRELFDPGDRRYRYPFINCTNCGPRFTIVTGVPYDRPNTTMAGFPMCSDCAREYRDPGDRRFHAQPVCCPACGPSLRLVDRDAAALAPAEDALARAVELVAAGAVLAVKGLGGYHLAVDAASEPAVSALRARKHREDKPFAVMVPDLDWAERLCEVDQDEAGLLAGGRRPIVLVRRRVPPDAPLAFAVAPGNRSLGLMLPYTPLHHLLARGLGRPFVLTSGNRSDEPIAYLDGEARERLGRIAEAFLVHDRPIHMRTDDSVVRSFRGRELPVRRSRGFAPQPVSLSRPVPRPVLACGAELKSTFCLARGRHAFVSHHIGDLENEETLRSFTEGIEHFQRLFDIRPRVVAHDLHPEYLSTKYALEQERVETAGVQHHHAHVASCLADNGEEGPVIGVAFDGLGYGTDGTLWGGEFLVADLAGFDRAGYFEPVPMPGGAAAIRQPWRMAAAYLQQTFGPEGPEDLAVLRRHEAQAGPILAMARAGVNSPLTSSAGRLFDAVAALLGVRDEINYEGQAAIELEQLADPVEPGAMAPHLSGDVPFLVSGTRFVEQVVDELGRDRTPSSIAARFHNGLALAILEGCRRIREAAGLSTVALSGGVFQNLVLLTRSVGLLEEDQFRVLVHSRVPPNDGGISLGQAAVAGARDRSGERAGYRELGPYHWSDPSWPFVPLPPSPDRR